MSPVEAALMAAWTSWKPPPNWSTSWGETFSHGPGPHSRTVSSPGPDSASRSPKIGVWCKEGGRFDQLARAALAESRGREVVVSLGLQETEFVTATANIVALAKADNVG